MIFRPAPITSIGATLCVTRTCFGCPGRSRFASSGFVLYSDTPMAAGAMIGSYSVEIQNIEPELDDQGKLVGPPPAKIPSRYSQQGNLTAEVKAGENSLNFELTSR